MVIRKKIFLLLSWLFVSLFPLFSSADGDCRAVFISGKDEIYHKVLNDKPSFMNSYKGQKGYLRFTEELSETLSMNYVFQTVYNLLSKEEKKELGWQQYQGRAPDYKELRSKIVNEEGQVRLEYIGMEGYALFAEREFSGDMKKTYVSVSSVLGGVKKTRELGLGWKIFKGKVEQFYALWEFFNKPRKYGMEKLKGWKGQELVAREIFNGDKLRAYDNVSVLRKELLGIPKAFSELNWLRASW